MEPFRCFLCSGLASRRVLRCQLFNIVSPFAKPAHGKQRLALSAAPFAPQVHIQHSHGAFTSPALRSAWMSFPSFLNFSHVPRATIREMTQPRDPSRKPRRRT